MIKFPKIQSTPFSKHFAGAWYRLVNILRKYTEHFPLTSDGADLVDGELVYASGDRLMDRTDTLSEAGAMCIGVTCEPTLDGEQGVIRTGGLAWVLFEAGIVTPAPAAGQTVFTATTPGRANNRVPELGGWTVPIGTIEDASTYDSLGGCYVNINRCCVPEEID